MRSEGHKNTVVKLLQKAYFLKLISPPCFLGGTGMFPVKRVFGRGLSKKGEMLNSIVA